jgi:hypothetical protein
MHRRYHAHRRRLKGIRPYHMRQKETVKFAGLRVTADCARMVKGYARKHGLSRGAAIAESSRTGTRRRARKSPGE